MFTARARPLFRLLRSCRHVLASVYTRLLAVHMTARMRASTPPTYLTGLNSGAAAPPQARLGKISVDRSPSYRAIPTSFRILPLPSPPLLGGRTAGRACSAIVLDRVIAGYDVPAPLPLPRASYFSAAGFSCFFKAVRFFLSATKCPTNDRYLSRDNNTVTRSSAPRNDRIYARGDLRTGL